jgi:hypothetical protein
MIKDLAENAKHVDCADEICTVGSQGPILDLRLVASLFLLLLLLEGICVGLDYDG